MIRIKAIATSFLCFNLPIKKWLASNYRGLSTESSAQFEPVYQLPFIKYFAAFNRLKVYHFAGSTLAVPGCGILEMLDAVPSDTFITSAYLAVTVGALLSAASLPLQNVIGFLYISNDNKKIKISVVDYWGKRKDRIVTAKNWFPLLDLPPRTLNVLFLAPQLVDGSKYKLFLRNGVVLNPKKMSDVLE